MEPGKNTNRGALQGTVTAEFGSKVAQSDHVRATQNSDERLPEWFKADRSNRSAARPHSLTIGGLRRWRVVPQVSDSKK
jgi:hypothetical protein